jgi:hypothetical protein
MLPAVLHIGKYMWLLSYLFFKISYLFFINAAYQQKLLSFSYRRISSGMRITVFKSYPSGTTFSSTDKQ